MLSISNQTQRSSPFSSSWAGGRSLQAEQAQSAPIAAPNRVPSDVVPRTADLAPATPSPELSNEPQAGGSWLSNALDGAAAALKQVAEQIDLRSRIDFLRGNNGAGALNREWAQSLDANASRLSGIGLALDLAEDIGEHGVIEGGLRTAVKEVGSDAGAALGVLLAPSLPLRIAGAAAGAVVGENLTDAALDEISTGYWAADSLYDDMLAAGGDLNAAARANLQQHQNWLSDPGLSPLERAGQFVVDGLQTFGGDVAVLWDGASDWLSGGESVDTQPPSFDAPVFEWTEPAIEGGWSDFDDGVYAWSDFNDLSADSSSLAQSF